jgi:hypothetical protein
MYLVMHVTVPYKKGASNPNEKGEITFRLDTQEVLCLGIRARAAQRPSLRARAFAGLSQIIIDPALCQYISIPTLAPTVLGHKQIQHATQEESLRTRKASPQHSKHLCHRAQPTRGPGGPRRGTKCARVGTTSDGRGATNPHPNTRTIAPSTTRRVAESPAGKRQASCSCSREPKSSPRSPAIS